jgi:transcription termination/antitermination protein NusG
VTNGNERSDEPVVPAAPPEAGAVADAVVEAEAILEAADDAAEQVVEATEAEAGQLLEHGLVEEAGAELAEGFAEAAAIEAIAEEAATDLVEEALVEEGVVELVEEVLVEEAVVALVEEALIEEAAEAPEPVPVDKPVPMDKPAPVGKPVPVDKPAPVEEPTAAESASDPFRGPGDWYVVHTYAGYENKVKANLESRIHTMQMEGKIFRVHIPMEDVMEIKSGKKQVVQKKVFPGYLLVKMIYDNDSWYVVRNTPGVTGFVSAGTGSKPTPLSKREVEKILVVKKEEVKPQFRLGFEESDVVRIISGPFADFNGTISEINVDQSKLKVLVNIFDRETPVELGFDQVSKV